jgi:hypothetical protein
MDSRRGRESLVIEEDSTFEEDTYEEGQKSR